MRKLQICEIIKERLQHTVFSSECWEIFKSTYFEEHLLIAASDFLKQLQNTGELLLLYWLFYYV